MILRKTAMFRAVVGALATIASAAVFAAPSVQTCAPMEILHGAGTGLAYQLSCEAGPWKLRYSGSVPAGEEPVNAQYRLAVAGPQGVSFVQHRVARLPAPAKLGQVLVREAVLLDNGDLALRDCKEANCTRYRPMSAVADEKAANTAASVTVTPEVKRLQEEQKQLTRDIGEMQAKFKAERELLETQAAAKLKAEHEAANIRLSQVLERLSVLEAENKRLAADKTGVEARITACAEQAGTLTSAQGSIAALNADLARLTEAHAKSTSALTAEQDSGAKLAAEVASLKRDLAVAHAAEVGSAQKAELSAGKAGALEQALAQRTAELSAAEARVAAAEAKTKMTPAEKSAYDFALVSLVAQHNEQVAAVRQALPSANLAGILDEMKVPRIANEPPVSDVADTATSMSASMLGQVTTPVAAGSPAVAQPLSRKTAITAAKAYCRKSTSFKACVHAEVTKRMAATAVPQAEPAQGGVPDNAPQLQLDAPAVDLSAPAQVPAPLASPEEHAGGFLSRMFKPGQ